MTTQNLNKLPGTIAVPMDKIRITILLSKFLRRKMIIQILNSLPSDSFEFKDRLRITIYS
ncbi:hypothetical protein ACXOWI_08860 [Streptococcus thermophilus]